MGTLDPPPGPRPAHDAEQPDPVPTPGTRTESATTHRGQGSPPPGEEPTLRALVVGNLKVVLVVLCFAVACWLLWRGAAALFPEIAWLQPRT